MLSRPRFCSCCFGLGSSSCPTLLLHSTVSRVVVPVNWPTILSTTSVPTGCPRICLLLFFSPSPSLFLFLLLSFLPIRCSYNTVCVLALIVGTTRYGGDGDGDGGDGDSYLFCLERIRCYTQLSNLLSRKWKIVYCMKDWLLFLSVGLVVFTVASCCFLYLSCLWIVVLCTVYHQTRVLYRRYFAIWVTFRVRGSFTSFLWLAFCQRIQLPSIYTSCCCTTYMILLLLLRLLCSSLSTSTRGSFAPPPPSSSTLL